MSEFAVRSFKAKWRCPVDQSVYGGFNVALTFEGLRPTANPVFMATVKPDWSGNGWYEYEFKNVVLDRSSRYIVWVQLAGSVQDSFWRSSDGIEVPDDGVGTLQNKLTIEALAKLLEGLPSGSINGGVLKPGSVAEGHLQNGAVTWDKIRRHAIGEGHIRPGSITADLLSRWAVTSDKVYPRSITNELLSGKAVTSDKIADWAVGTRNIALNAISRELLQNNAVTGEKIAQWAVGGDKIPPGTITAPLIASGAVVAGKIGANAVTANNIAAGAVTAGKVGANAIYADNIAAGAIITGKIAAAAIASFHIAANAITAGKIAADTIVTNNIRANNISQTAYGLGTTSAQANFYMHTHGVVLIFLTYYKHDKGYMQLYIDSTHVATSWSQWHGSTVKVVSAGPGNHRVYAYETSGETREVGIVCTILYR